jgi:hypothetical protein
MNILKKIKICHLKNDAYPVFFWVIIFLGILFICASYPMMKLRFDIWQHIGDIDSLVQKPELKIGRDNWHKVWAYIFKLFNINDIYEYAVVIHRVQFFLNCTLVYFASQQLFSALLLSKSSEVKIEKQWVSSLAISSVLVWLTVIGTVSTFQQAWIMWYSVNYQITLTFILCAVAICVNVMVMNQPKCWIVVKLGVAFTLIWLTYLFHAGELAYLLIYLIFIVIILTKKNQLPYIAIALGLFLVASYVAILFYDDRIPEALTLISNKDYSKIHAAIIEHGTWNVTGGNRYQANWNELYFASIYLALPILIFTYFFKISINKKTLYFIVASLIFCFIPTFLYSAGVASLVVGYGIVNRLYFASYIFLIIPIFLYILIINYRPLSSPMTLIIAACLFLMLTYSFSKFINGEGVFYKNVKSIKNSLNSRLVGVDLPFLKIEKIEQQIKQAESMHGADNIIFCANYEVGHIIKYQFKKNNIYFDRFKIYGLQDCFDLAADKKKLAIIIN